MKITEKIKRFKYLYNLFKDKRKTQLIQLLSYIWLDYNLKDKVTWLIQRAFDVTVTGITINYITTHHNWLSYGLLSALAMFYTDWLITLIGTKLLGRRL